MDEENKEEKSDTISIKVPPITKKVRENPWIFVSLILGVVVIVLLFMQFSGKITGKTISEDKAANTLIEFLNQESPGQFTLGDVSSEYGMYKVNVAYQGREIPIYVTKDGKLAGSFQPIVVDKISNNEPIEVSEDDDAVQGKDDAPVTIIEFSDYQCPFCGRYIKETYPQLKVQYIDTGKVRYVFRDFPLSFHENAQKFAEAAECVRDIANSNGKKGDEIYFKYHDKLFANQDKLDETSLKKYAKEVGINEDEFSSCLSSGKMADEVNSDLADGSSYGVTGTPAFFINGELLEGAQPFSAFKQAIDNALAGSNEVNSGNTVQL